MSGAKQAERAGAWRRYKPYPTYKDSGVEWLGSVPAGWEVKRLRFVSESNPVPSEARSLPGETEVSFVPMEAVGEYGGLSLVASKQLNQVKAGYTYFRDGDVLIAKITPCFENGKGALATGLTSGIAFGTTELHVLRATDAASPRFVFYITISDAFRRLGQADMYGAGGQKRVSESFVRDFSAALPSLEEQRAIVAFLDRETARIDALVAKKERLIALLQEQRTALITRAVTKGLDPTVPMRDSGVEWLGEIPAHWEVKKLAWLTECLDGRRVPLNAEERGRMQGEYPYWGANSIVDYVDQWLFDEELVLLGEDGAPFFDRTKSVAFHVRGKVWVNNHAHVLRPRRQIAAPFLTHALNCVDYRVFIGGTTRDKLTQGDMNAISIQCPSLDEQATIVALLYREIARIDALVAKVRDAIGRLKELRTALISAAVTGKIDVREKVA